MNSSLSTNLFLVRHGATPSNEQRPQVLQGSSVDAPLSDRGRNQARQVGRFLSTFAIDAVFSSPLQRAVETAGAIAEHHSHTVEQVDGILEVNVGRWERLDWGTIERDFPDEYRRFTEDPVHTAYLGGESYVDVQNRIVPAFEKLLVENCGRTIVVVAHSVVNRTWLATLLGLDLAKLRGLPQDNCCINVIRWENGVTKLTTLNSTFHLDAD